MPSLCSKIQALCVHVCFLCVFARWFSLSWLSALRCASLFLCMCMCMCMYAAAAAAAAAPLTTCLGCGSSDSGGIARKSVAMSLVLSPMKRVQSSPNLGAGTNTHWHVFSQHGSGRNTRRNFLPLNECREKTRELRFRPAAPCCPFRVWLSHHA